MKKVKKLYISEILIPLKELKSCGFAIFQLHVQMHKLVKPKVMHIFY